SGGLVFVQKYRATGFTSRSIDFGEHWRVSRHFTRPVHHVARIRWSSDGRIGGRSATANAESARELYGRTKWACTNSKQIGGLVVAQSTHGDARGDEAFARKRQGGRGGANDRSASPGALPSPAESGCSCVERAKC